MLIFVSERKAEEEYKGSGKLTSDGIHVFECIFRSVKWLKCNHLANSLKSGQVVHTSLNFSD